MDEIIKKPKRLKKFTQSIEVKVEKKVPKLVKKKFPLIKDVSINGNLQKKGTIVELTKQGEDYFKSKFYI
jgi:hypothetical protein